MTSLEQKLKESERYLQKSKQCLDNLFSQIPVIRHFQSLEYYPFEQEWKSKFAPLLEHPDIKRTKELILQDTFENFINAETCHSSIDLSRISNLENITDITAELDKYGWGFLASMQSFSDTDKQEMDACQDLKYHDPSEFGHYLLLRCCHSLALLIYDLVVLAFPDKQNSFRLVSTNHHCFVIDNDNLTTVYDFLWYKLGLKVDQVFENSLVYIYETRQDYIDKFFRS